MWERLKNRDPVALAQAVGVVAIVGSLGSLVGRVHVVVPAASFGNTGEWVGAAAAVTALLGIAKQLEVAQSQHEEVLMADRLRAWHDHKEEICGVLLELRTSVVKDDPVNGVAVSLDTDIFSQRLGQCVSRVRSLRSDADRLEPNPVKDCGPAFDAWHGSVLSYTSGYAAKFGFSDTTAMLQRELEAIAR